MADPINRDDAMYPMISSDPPPGPASRTPAASVRWLLITAGLLLAGFATLAVMVWRGRHGLAFDSWFLRQVKRLPLRGRYRYPHGLALLASPPPAVLFVAVMWLWARRTGDRALRLFVLLVPLGTAVIADAVAKPLIGRLLGATFSFPSGHSAMATAMAVTFLGVLYWTPRPGLSARARAVRLLVTVGALAFPFAVAFSVVAIGWHAITDGIGALLLTGGFGLLALAFCRRWVPADRPLIPTGSLRALAVLVGLGTAALIGAIRLPFLVLSPGSLIPLNSAVTVSGDAAAQAGPLNGTYSGLTVRAVTLTFAGWLYHEARGSEDMIIPRQAVIPAGENGNEYHQEQRKVFDSASQVAIAVAEEALGQPVKVFGDGALITAVQPGSPADGHLRANDVVTAIDGEVVATQDDLRRVLGAIDAAHPASADGTGADNSTFSVEATLTVRNGEGEVRTETIGLRRLASTGRLGLGVGVDTANPQFTMPTDVTVNGGDVGGPSAGLLTALAVYDALSPTDVAAGRHITGTGTLSLDGRVGDIGGIEEKVRAAIAAGADVFLAPAHQADTARDAARGRIPVVAVDSFDAALTALQTA